MDTPPNRNKKNDQDGPGVKTRMLLMWLAAFACIMLLLHLIGGARSGTRTGIKELQVNEFLALLKQGSVSKIHFRGTEKATAFLVPELLDIQKHKSLTKLKGLVLKETDNELVFLGLDGVSRVIQRDQVASRRPLVGADEQIEVQVVFPEGYLDHDGWNKILNYVEPSGSVTFAWQEAPVNIKHLLWSFAPWFLFLILIWFLILRQMRGPGGSSVLSFGKSRARMARKSANRITFDDVAGVDEAKEEVREIIEFLKNPNKFQRLGGRIPRGILLVGAPGTGKTLLAKAIAGEADVPFFSISGSDFVEMFVGIGASRVRDLFRQAKEHSPCIVFLDEIDAVGRRRGTGLGGGHDEREQTLNAILVEMDGFDTDSGVILIAATNRPDVLDPALLRPGRFDRQVVVDLPDVRGREAILRVHARDKKLAPDCDFNRLAKSTPFFSGADLENLMNEAALLAALRGQDAIYGKDLEEARDKVQFGREKRSRVLPEEEKRISAFHETGHAVVAKMTPESAPLHKVTIIPRGMALGATHLIPDQDYHLISRKRIIGDISVLLGGRAAEELFLDDITSGGQNDFERATELARMMVCKWGMSENLGPVSYSENEENIFLGRDLARIQSVSEATAVEIDREIKAIIDSCFQRAKHLLNQKSEEVHRIVKELLRKETLDANEVDRLIFGEGTPTDETAV